MPELDGSLLNAKASTHEEGSWSGSEFTMVEAPSSESDGIPDTEVEIRDGMSDIHVSEVERTSTMLTLSEHLKFCPKFVVSKQLFSDMRAFAVFGWGDILESTKERLSGPGRVSRTPG